jgi:hypothetical protein
MANLEGGCLCGKARYQLTADPVATALCHCTTCQKQSGAAFSVNAVVPREAFQVEGDSVRTFTTQSDEGGTVDRQFCGECGSPLVSLASYLPFAIVKAGTLDDKSTLPAPTVQVFCRSAQPWVPRDEIGGQQFEAGMPARG